MTDAYFGIFCFVELRVIVFSFIQYSNIQLCLELSTKEFESPVFSNSVFGKDNSINIMDREFNTGGSYGSMDRRYYVRTRSNDDVISPLAAGAPRGRVYVMQPGAGGHVMMSQPDHVIQDGGYFSLGHAGGGTRGYAHGRSGGGGGAGAGSVIISDGTGAPMRIQPMDGSGMIRIGHTSGGGFHISGGEPGSGRVYIRPHQSADETGGGPDGGAPTQSRSLVYCTPRGSSLVHHERGAGSLDDTVTQTSRDVHHPLSGSGHHQPRITIRRGSDVALMAGGVFRSCTRFHSAATTI